MLTRKTSRTITMTMLLAAGAITLGAVACEKTTPEGTTSTNNNPSTNTPSQTNSPAGAPGAATITGATIQQDPLANVENKASVKEYPDEMKINPPKATQLITGFAIQARESPRGDMITSVETSQPVREVARDARGDYYLVVFADPKDSTKQMAGWVYKDALENNSWASDNSAAATGGAANAKTGANAPAKNVQKLNCANGDSHLRTSIDFCAKTCKDDKGCDKTAGEICDGLGFEVHESTGKLSNSNYCVSSTSPNANRDHSSEHGSSAPLDQMNKNYDPNNPAGNTKPGNNNPSDKNMNR